MIPGSHPDLLRRSRAMMATVLCATLLGPTLFASMPALAQQPAPGQQAPPGQPAPGETGGPAVIQVRPVPSQEAWSKICGNDATTRAEACFTMRDFISAQDQPVLAVAVFDLKGGPQGGSKLMRVLTPLGLVLWQGLRLSVDQGQPVQGRFSVCLANGCFAEVPGLKDDFLTQLRRGVTLNVTALNQAGREIKFAVPLLDFGKAYDGPPIDPKVLEEQQKKQQEEFGRRSAELRSKLEQSGTIPGGPAAPPATPKQQ